MPTRLPHAIVVGTLALLPLAAPLRAQGAVQPPAATPAAFRIEEATIADVHAALRSGALSCRQLVQGYLRRIEAYDKNGPAINAIVVINPAALATADSLDRRYARDGFVGPLHCVPTIVKDNFETIDLPTSAGTLALKGWQPTRDAFQVQRVRAAGAIVLAKSNMAELAFSPNETVSSILAGYTRNPYALDRVTAGSSGGTAAAVASSFGTVGLGSDTGNSIRGPSSHQALVGIRSTMGLTSRNGVVPLFDSQDIAGPMTRTVADAAAVFQVIAGEDPGDPVTAAARGRPIPRYADSLRADGLRGARIGVLHAAYDTPTLDAEVNSVFQQAIDDLRRLGATVIDPVAIPTLDSLRRLQSGACSPFRHDFETHMARVADSRPPVSTVDEILKSGRFHPSIEARLAAAVRVTESPAESPGCQARERYRAGLRLALRQLMDSLRLDAVAYPTWSNPPRLIGDLNTPGGDNSQVFSPATGFPAITVPMGYTRTVLPAGLQLLARPFAEGTLFKLAHSYEQGTRHRRPPPTVPPLR
ncbi:MAG TPA: amidase family protein [Gemmatimonadaceae bacterium]|nr:amidase family protein [Gemmatimonadaceae bacterium]